MHAIEFFNSDVLELPKTRADSDFERYIGGVLDGYIEALDQVRHSDFISQNVLAKHDLVRLVSEDLEGCVSLAVHGDRDASYEKFKAAIQRLGSHFNQFFPPQDIARELKSLYRMAIVPGTVPDRGRMFHCPFHLPQYITAQRYSVTGLPCLYFGGSAYLCWKELREPAEDGLYISRFEVAPNVSLKVVNLAYRPALMAALVANNLPAMNRESSLSAMAVSYAACWPLMAICAIRQLGSDASKPEYIVPQMLLRWVTETRQFDGIRFFSTRMMEYFDDPKTNSNYVFPARTTPPSGHCTELVKMFKVSEPLHWRDAEKTIPSSITLRARYKIREVVCEALESKYGRVESVIDEKPVEFLS